MAIPENNEALQKAILTHYKKLKETLSEIKEEDAWLCELPGHAKGTLMSIHNLIAYLTGWGQLVLKWNSKKDNDEEFEWPETGYKWNELGKLAQKFYKNYASCDYRTLKEKLDETVQNILQLIESKSNAELYGVLWYGKWTLGRMIQFNTSSPYQNARTRIRKWQKEKKLI